MWAHWTALDTNQSSTCFLEIKKEIKTIRRGQLPFRFYANRSAVVTNVISILWPQDKQNGKWTRNEVAREFKSYRVSRWGVSGKCSLANIDRIWEYTRAVRGCNSARHTFAIVGRYWMEIRQRESEYRTIARTDDTMIAVIRYKDTRTELTNTDDSNMPGNMSARLMYQNLDQENHDRDDRSGHRSDVSNSWTLQWSPPGHLMIVMWPGAGIIIIWCHNTRQGQD